MNGKFKDRIMIHVVRFFFVLLITFVITIFVVDFQSVVDGFGSAVDAISGILSPVKALFK